ncbi:MAG TPA: hypothetical protein VNZ47_14195 [Candidatus Dormibacteraeota bacterium]|jgi:hypothetical protein|nr:hypothetical protein [Candidatus Dormibacteraeota bacterium]
MPDETARKRYESAARDRLKELLRQEGEIKEHISHWGAIVEQLARGLSRELTRMNTNKEPFAADFADERGSGKTQEFTAKGAKERKGDQGQEKRL